MLCLVSIPMHSFLAQTLTILLHFGTGDPLHSIDCEQKLFETVFDTNVHVEASASYPRVPETNPLAHYVNEVIRNEAQEFHDTFVQEMSTPQEELWEEDGDERILRYDLSLVHNEERKNALIEAVRNGSAVQPGSISIYMVNSIFRMSEWSIRLVWLFQKNWT